jgi:accessory gene regulator B
MTRKFTEFLVQRYNLDYVEGLKLKYAIDLFLNETSKWLIIGLIFFGMHQMQFYFVMTLSLLIIKPITGGLHFSSYLKCLGFTICFMMTAFFLYKQINLRPAGYLLLVLMNATIIFLVAPIMTKAKQNVFPERNIRRRNFAIAIVLLHLLYFISGQSSIWVISLWTLTLHALLLLYARRKLNV